MRVDGLIGLLALGFCCPLSAQGRADIPLPEPLTLSYALSLADETHPDLEYATAALHGAQAGQQAAQSRLRPRLNLLGALKAVEPNNQAEKLQNTNNDSWVKLRLTQRSDVELLRAQTRYEQRLQRRRLSQAQQHAARSRLAIALNRPGQLSSMLETPVLEAGRRQPGDPESLSGVALDSNPALKALRARILAAQKRVLSARAESKPVLRGELEAAAWARRSLTRDHFSAALVLDVPLVTGGAVNAKVAREQAQLDALTGRLLNADEGISASQVQMSEALGE